MKKNILIWIAFLLPFFVNAQELKKISPNNSKAGKTLTVTITGKKTHFLQGSGTTVYFSGGLVNTFQVLDDKKIEATLTIPVNVPTGVYYVSVYNIGIDSSLSIAFSVQGVPVPQLISADPASADSGQTLDVTITGINTHFKKGKNEVHFGFTQATATTTVVSNTVLKARITVPATTTTGNYNISVENAADGYLRLDNVFHVNGVAVTPGSLQSVSPSATNQGKNLTVSITGINTHFDSINGTKVWFHFSPGSSTIIVNSGYIVTPTTLYANITVPIDAAIGNYTVEVKNSVDGSMLLPNAFQVQKALPEIIYVYPKGALPGQTVDVTVMTTRTHYRTSLPLVQFDFGTGVYTESDSVTVVDDSIIIAKVTIPSNTVKGIHRLIVTNTVDGQLFGNFEVFPLCNTFFATSYDSIANSFTLTMDSLTSGAIFINWDFGDGTYSLDPNPTHVFADNRLYNVCLTTLNNAGDTCKYCRFIGKDSLGNIFTRIKGFTANFQSFKPLLPTKLSTEENTDRLISVYPNPATDAITLVISNVITMHDYTLSIYGIDGKLLKQQIVPKNKTEIDISDLAKGMYLLQITGDSRSEMMKIIKE